MSELSGAHTGSPNPLLNAVLKFIDSVIKEFEAGKESGTKDGLPEIKKRLVMELERAYLVNNEWVKQALIMARKEAFEAVMKALKEAGYCYVGLVFRSESRIIVGHSEGILSTIFEVGQVFDYVRGLPIIPGSSLKGLTRSFLERQCNDLGDEGFKKECLGLVRELFGYSDETASASRLVFMDAYPVGVDGARSLILADVITPHYYMGGQPVKNELMAEPKPVLHVSVSPGTLFGVVIALRDRKAVDLLARLGELLGMPKNGLIALAFAVSAATKLEGVGARTTKGYGTLELLPDEIYVSCGERA